MKIYFLGYVFDIGRNDPCFCKSGKKFKKCCLLKVDSVDFNNPTPELLNRPVLHARKWLSKRPKWGQK
jgi:hypothetical protein